MATNQTMKLTTSWLDINKAFFYHCLKQFPEEVKNQAATGEIIELLEKVDTSLEIELSQNVHCVLDPDASGPGNVVKYDSGKVTQEQLAAPSLDDLKALCYFLDKMESTYYVHIDVTNISDEDLKTKVKSVFEKLDAKTHSSNETMKSTQWTVVILFTDSGHQISQVYRVRYKGTEVKLEVDLDGPAIHSPIGSNLNSISDQLVRWIFGPRRDARLDTKYSTDQSFRGVTRNRDDDWTSEMTKRTRQQSFVSLLLAPNDDQIGRYSSDLTKGVLWCYYSILASASNFTSGMFCPNCGDNRPHPHANVWFVDGRFSKEVLCSSIGRICGSGTDSERMFCWQVHQWQTRKEKAMQMSGRKRTSGSLLLTQTPESQAKKTRQDRPSITVPPTQLFAGQDNTRNVIASCAVYFEDHYKQVVGVEELQQFVNGGNDRFWAIDNMGILRQKVADNHLDSPYVIEDFPLDGFLKGLTYRSSRGQTNCCSSRSCNNVVEDVFGLVREQARRCDLCFLMTCGADCLSEGICTNCREAYFCCQWRECTNKKENKPKPLFLKVDDDGKPVYETPRGHKSYYSCSECNLPACAIGGCILDIHGVNDDNIAYNHLVCRKCAKTLYLNCSCESCQEMLEPPPSDSHQAFRDVRLESCPTCKLRYNASCKNAKSHPTKGNVCGSNNCLGFARPPVQADQSDCPFCPNTKLKGAGDAKGEQFLWQKQKQLLGCWNSHHCKAWIKERVSHLGRKTEVVSLAKLLAQSMKNVTEIVPDTPTSHFFLHPDDFDKKTTLVDKLKLLVPLVLEVFASKHNSSKDFTWEQWYEHPPFSPILDENMRRAFISKPHRNFSLYQKLLPFISRAAIYRIRKCIDTIQQDGFADMVKKMTKIEVYNHLMIALVAVDPFRNGYGNIFFCRQWWNSFINDDFLIFQTEETLYAGHNLEHTFCNKKTERMDMAKTMSVDSIIRNNAKFDPVCCSAECKKPAIITMKSCCCSRPVCPDHAKQICATCSEVQAAIMSGAAIMDDFARERSKLDKDIVEETEVESTKPHKAHLFSFPFKGCGLHSPITDGVLGSKPKPEEPARLDKSSQLVYFYQTDAARLGKAVYANDAIVNLGMNWLTRYHWLEGGNCDVCSISSQFLTRFRDVEKNGVETANKLTKHCTNVFEKKLILMPLNTKKSHWSLVVIINPGAILDNKKESVILHLDSLSCHNPSLFHDYVLQWLNYRWKKEHQDMTDDVFTSDTMKVVSPEGLQQQTDFTSCGYYVLVYASALVKISKFQKYETDAEIQKYETDADDWGQICKHEHFQFSNSAVANLKTDLSRLVTWIQEEWDKGTVEEAKTSDDGNSTDLSKLSNDDPDLKQESELTKPRAKPRVDDDTTSDDDEATDLRISNDDDTDSDTFLLQNSLHQKSDDVHPTNATQDQGTDNASANTIISRKSSDSEDKIE